MSDSTRDRIEGNMDQAKGKGKSALGDLSNDEELKREGDRDQAVGNVKEGLADAKDKVDDAVKKITDR